MATRHSKAARTFQANVQRAELHDNTLWGVRVKRVRIAVSLPEWEQLRDMASAIKKHTLSHLDTYLEKFSENAQKNGVIVHWAKDAEEFNSIVLDIGTGTGIISILLSAKTEANKIIGIEIQREVADMAKRSVILNKLENKIEIINDDINNIEKYFENNYFDVIVTNPPYQKNNTGLKSENEKNLISRHEIKCTLEDIIKKSFKILKDKGEFYMVHRPERLVDIMYLMKKNKIEPKELRFVYPKISDKPNLILINGIKNAKQFLKVEKPLIIYNEEGIYTKEVLSIYGK